MSFNHDQNQQLHSRDSRVYIFGAGAHGRVVADILLSTGVSVAGFIDENPSLQGDQVAGLPVLGPLMPFLSENLASRIIIALGRPPTRLRFTRVFQELGYLLVNAIHVSAIVSPSAKLGIGNCLCAGTVINSGAVLGDAVIINTSATVDHDCRIGDGAHLSPGVHLAGRVEVGRLSFIGVGAAVAPRVMIGDRTVVGAGSVVVRDLPSGVLAYGVPAKPVREIDDNFDWSHLL
jgi:sugar O-acyltransferase (sialic acid O-acetyltransferase NeuD family)